MAGLLLLAAAAPAQQAEPPTFAHDIAKIVYRSCTPCHRPGQPAPFPLGSYDEVFAKRTFLAQVVEDRYMPPWQPTHGDFLGDRRLRKDEIALLRRWVDAGAPRGGMAEEPAPPQFASGWQLGEPDLIVRMPDVLTVPASGPDIVRNFIVPVALEQLRYVAALEIRPNNPAVHHLVLGVDGTHQSRQLDARDEAPGFPGMTLGAAVPPDGHFLGWTPGKSVRQNVDGMAWRLRPGDDFVLQIHAVPVGKEERVQPEIGIWFTNVPTVRTFDMVLLFSEQIDIAPGVEDFVLRDHVVLPVPVTLHALYPHAHYVCRRMRGTATLPDGSERVLFAIDDWDFDWQDDYDYAQPVQLPAGTRIAIEYVYDNSDQNDNNPIRPLRRVRFGQESTDEMGTLTLSLTLQRDADRAALQMALTDRELEKLPDAWNILVKKARLERERGRFAESSAAIERACKISPGAPDVWVERGMLAEQQGKLDDAVQDYRRALAVDGDCAMAHMQLGAIFGRRGDGERALGHFEAAVEMLPNSAIAHNNVATANFVLDRLDVAERHYRSALALDPNYFNAQLNLGRVLMIAGHEQAAKKELQRAAELRPDVELVKQLLRQLGS